MLGRLCIFACLFRDCWDPGSIASTSDWMGNGLGERERAISVISITENREPKDAVFQLL